MMKKISIFYFIILYGHKSLLDSIKLNNWTLLLSFLTEKNSFMEVDMNRIFIAA